MHYTIAIFLIFFSTLNAAQETPLRVGNNSTCVSSVETLMNASFKTYPSIQSSRYIIQGADAQLEGAKWNYFPTPSVDVSQGSGRTGTTIRLDQPLWTGGKLDAMVDIAQSRKNESQYALDESAYALMDNLLRVLQNYVQADGSIAALEDGKKQLEIFDQMLSRRIEAGVSSVADSELIKSRLSQISADLTVARSKRNTSRSQLELLIGSKLECDIEFGNTKIIKQTTPIDLMMDQMIQTHPSLKKLTEQIKTAEFEKAKAKAVVWPNVSLRAEHLRGSMYSDQSVTDNVVYVAVSMSPGAGLSALSSIQSAESKVLQVQSDKLSKERELSDALMLDFDNYHASMDRIDGMNKTIEASQNVLDSYTRLFIAGKRQWLDLVNSSRELTQNKISLADIKATLVTSAYRLALKNGEIKLESGETK
jgi:adhesin transport system outer membrane protein